MVSGEGAEGSLAGDCAMVSIEWLHVDHDAVFVDRAAVSFGGSDGTLALGEFAVRVPNTPVWLDTWFG